MESLFKILCLVFTLVVLLCTSKTSCYLYHNEHLLDAGDVYSCCDSQVGSIERNQPQIYCYNGRKKHVIHLFETVLLEINIPPDQYNLYEGRTAAEVMIEFESHRSLWDMNIFTWRSKDVRLNPFNSTCIGIVSSRNYKVELNVIRFDYWRVLLFTCGVLLFYFGPRLSKNVLFYYICGITLGVFASFLILVYVFSRLLPRKPMMYGFVVGGWAISLYVLQMIWDNIRTLSVAYRKYVIGYFIATGIISFVVCYRLGPVTNPKSKNLIKWALQGVGLVMVLYSSHFQEASLAIDMIIIILYNIPKSWLFFFKRAYKSYFDRPRPRLLNEDEYYEEGVRETTKALEELRGFCSSPNCDQWKTVIRLKDPVSLHTWSAGVRPPLTCTTVQDKRNEQLSSMGSLFQIEKERFAQFVQGNSHLDDGEILLFDSETNKVLLNEDDFTDDSDG